MAHPVLREFYKERGVVMEERRLRTDDSPNGLLYETFTSTAFQAHQYGVPTIGWASDIQSLTPAATEAFFKTYYGPNNATVAIVGDINPKEVMALTRADVREDSGLTSPPPILTQEPSATRGAARRSRVRCGAVAGDRLPQARARASADDFVFDVIDSVLSDGMTSRLYTTLVKEKRIAASVMSDPNYPGVRAPNLFVIAATPLAPHTTAEVEAAMLRRSGTTQD